MYVQKHIKNKSISAYTFKREAPIWKAKKTTSLGGLNIMYIKIQRIVINISLHYLLCSKLNYMNNNLTVYTTQLVFHDIYVKHT